MTRTGMNLLLPALLLAPAACGPVIPRLQPLTLTPQDSAQIRALLNRDQAAVRANDWDALAGLLADDAVRMPPAADVIRGRRAIAASLKAIPRVTQFEFTPHAIGGRGDLAVGEASSDALLPAAP